MRGWIKSNSVRANRHWQSGGWRFDIFKDIATDPETISPNRANMLTLDRLLTPSERTQYSYYLKDAIAGTSIITILQNKIIQPITPQFRFTRVKTKKQTIHIKGIQNIAVDGLEMYLTGLVFEGLQQPESSAYKQYNVDASKRTTSSFTWNGIYAHGVSRGEQFTGNVYENDVLKIKVIPKTWKSFTMPTWGLNGPKDQNAMDQCKTIVREGCLLTDGIDVAVTFKDPSKCNVLMITEFGFCSNSYDLKTWQWAGNTIYAWDVNIPRSYRLEMK